MKHIYKGLLVSPFALLSCFAMAHAAEAEITVVEHQSMHISDAILPVALMIAISIIARPFFKRMREKRIRNEQSQDK